MRKNIRDYISSSEDFEEQPLTQEEVEVSEAPIAPQAVEIVQPVVEPVFNPEDTPVVVEPSVGQVVEENTVPLDVQEVVTTDPVVQTIDQDQVEQTIIEEQYDQMVDVKESLEAYSELLKQSGLDGISQQTAAFMRVGLKPIERVLGVNKVTASLESYTTDPRSALMPATVSKEDIKEYASKAYEKAKEFILKLIKLIVEGYNNLMSGITKLEHKVKGVQEKLKTAKGTPNQDSYILTNPSPVFIGNVNKVNDPKMVVGLAHFTTYAYPKAVKSYYESLAKTVNQYNVVKADSEALIEKLNTTSNILKKLKDSGELFPGNYSVDVSEDGVSYGMRYEESIGEGGDGSVELKVRTIPELKKVTTVIDGLVTILKATREEHEKIKDGANSLIKAIDKIESQVKSDELDDSSKQNAQAVINHALSLVRKSNPRGKEITQYLVRTANAYITIIDKELSFYS